jgi:uncharacterized cupredoxin-like copper-binding protein
VSAHPGHRGLLVAAVIAGIALLAGTGAVIALAANDSTGSTGPANGAYGTVSCTVPTLPGSTVDVQVTDAGDAMMGQMPMRATLVASPTSVPSGKVSFAVVNTGALVHELVILPLPADGPGTRPVGSDGKVDESQSFGEASRSCGAGTGDGISPGSTSWTTVTLAPGRYELVCDQPWHYAAGMFDVLTVT